MERQRMSEAFTSICGKTCSLSDNLVKRSALEHNMDVMPDCVPELAGTRASEAPDKCADQSAQAALTSLVNVKSCANTNRVDILEAYFTFAREGVYLRGYMY